MEVILLVDESIRRLTEHLQTLNHFMKVKVKQSRYSPGVAQRVLGS